MKRFLLVEDHALFRECLALLLDSPMRFDNVQARSLAEANLVLGDRTITIDMAIVDVDLPDGEGIKLIEMLRRSEPDMPILALTAARAPDQCAWALRAGADEVLSMRKPIEEVLHAVGRLGGDAPRLER